MITVHCEMSNSVRTHDFVVVLESMVVQSSVPDVCQTRVLRLKLGVIIAHKCEVLISLEQFREILGNGRRCGAYTALIARLYGCDISAETSSAVKYGKFSLLC
jgi:hypothetical protein